MCVSVCEYSSVCVCVCVCVRACIKIYYAASNFSDVQISGVSCQMEREVFLEVFLGLRIEGGL